jgi:hypothetical protein
MVGYAAALEVTTVLLGVFGDSSVATVSLRSRKPIVLDKQGLAEK